MTLSERIGKSSNLISLNSTISKAETQLSCACDSDEEKKLEDIEIVGYSEAEESDTDEVVAVNESIQSFTVPKLRFQAKIT